MLPNAYGLPAAILLVLGGALACFAGYRLFRLVLGIYGFIIGAMIGSALAGSDNTLWMVGGAIVGGLLGSVILVFAYFVGIAIAGAGLGALVAHMAWSQTASGDPAAALVVVAAVAGAIGAMLLQRYVIIVATSFGGAWTLIVGVFGAIAARAGSQPTRATSAADTWILYPLAPANEAAWIPFAWVVLGLIGMAVQLAVTAKKK